MVIILQFLTAPEAHGVATMPLCRTHYKQISSSCQLWMALCSGEPWRLPAKHVRGFHTAPSAQFAHRRLVTALQTAERALTVHAILKPMEDLPDAFGVQMQCLLSLVPMLEQQENRKVAQATCLTSLIVCAMGEFSDDIALQIAALHTLVLLARPIGGSEGMVFSRGMASPPGLQALLGERGGIATVLKTMRAHRAFAEVQAMSCWALVNVMLIPAQKQLLISRGGVEAVLESMKAHPCVFEVQYRALFALINLLVPDGSPASASHAAVLPFVLRAMTRFETNEALVNRGCLVIHNLALSEHNHHLLKKHDAPRLLAALLRAHPKEHVVQESATGVLRRLGMLHVLNPPAVETAAAEPPATPSAVLPSVAVGSIRHLPTAAIDVILQRVGRNSPTSVTRSLTVP